MGGHQVTGFPAPGGAVPLAANESPLPPGATVIAAIEARLPLVHRYPEPGASELRAILAEHFEVRPEQVLIGHGASELLWMIALALLKQGERFVFPSPSYYAYPALAELTGAEPVPVALDPTGANDLAAMADAAQAGASLLCVCEPNTPTGGAAGPGPIEWLLREVMDSVPVVLDEAFWEFSRHADQRRENALLGAAPNLIVVRTFSKAHRLAGARIGYAVFGSAERAAEVDAVRPTFPVSSLAEAAAIAALADRAGLAAHVETVRTTREAMRRGLEEVGFEVAPSEGNFLWATPPAGVADAALAAEAEATAGLQVAAGSELCGINGLRVTAGTMQEGEIAIEALRCALEVLS